MELPEGLLHFLEDPDNRAAFQTAITNIAKEKLGGLRIDARVAYEDSDVSIAVQFKRHITLAK